MSRIGKRFAALRSDGKRALVCFITAGDGGVEITLATMHAMVVAGADIVELGVPFSDPMADGPAIQLASERALSAGTTLSAVFDVVRRFRQSDANTPVVLMGYLNPIEARGAEKFVEDAAANGVDGLIIVDMPPEEGTEVLAAMRATGLDPIFLIAPTTIPERMAAICKESGGFVYFVSIKGVTGTRRAVASEVADKVSAIRGLTSLPVGVGFGIRDEASAKAMAEVCDAVIVGTALVEKFAEHADTPAAIPKAVASVVVELRRGVDSAA